MLPLYHNGKLCQEVFLPDATFSRRPNPPRGEARVGQAAQRGEICATATGASKGSSTGRPLCAGRTPPGARLPGPPDRGHSARPALRCGTGCHPLTPSPLHSRASRCWHRAPPAPHTLSPIPDTLALRDGQFAAGAEPVHERGVLSGFRVADPLLVGHTLGHERDAALALALADQELPVGPAVRATPA